MLQTDLDYWIYDDFVADRSLAPLLSGYTICTSLKKGHKKTVLTGHRFFFNFAANTLLPITQ